jgi:5,6,7,8-tetrahydromethanopterin hydro-lyase
MASPDELDGCIGEAWAGDVPNGSHINVVIARRGSATAAAAVAGLSIPTQGHAPVVVCLGAGNAVRPATIMKNKATVDSDAFANMTWGAAQLGIGQGVLDAVEQGVLDAAQADELVLLVAVWVDPEANDETTVRLANREATLEALRDALPQDRSARVGELSATRDAARNAFYSGN